MNDESQKVYIYALRDPRTNKIRYIGKTKDLELRLKQHLQPARLVKHSHKNHWLQGLIADGMLPEIEVLHTVAPTRADTAERAAIAVARIVGDLLTNATKGGDGGFTGCRPPIHHGEANNMAVLSDGGVRSLRERHAAGEACYVLANELRLTRANVTQLVTGQFRAAAGGPIRAPKVKQRLTDDDVRDIRRLVAEGNTHRLVASTFGVTQGHVTDIANGRKRKHLPLGR